MKEYYTAMKQRTVLILEQIAGKDTAAQIEKVEAFLLGLIPPQNYSGPTGAEVELVRAYERACAVMSQHISRNPKRMTVLEFYETLEALKGHNKKQYEPNGKPY